MLLFDDLVSDEPRESVEVRCAEGREGDDGGEGVGGWDAGEEEREGREDVKGRLEGCAEFYEAGKAGRRSSVVREGRRAGGEAHEEGWKDALTA